MITIVILIVTVILSILCFNNRALFDKLALKPYRVIHHHEWYRMITHAFVHADWLHLGVNMFTFWSFGSAVEHLFTTEGYGSLIFILLYFLGIIASSVSDLIHYRNVTGYTTIGASGAVSAVLFTSIFFCPWCKVLLFAALPIPGIVFGVLYLFYCQYMARQSKDNINHNAHFYGALFGFIYPIILDPHYFKLFLHTLLHP